MNNTKNIVCQIDKETYAKLKYISEIMGIELPKLMNSILNQDVFKNAVNEMFKTITTAEKLPWV